MKTLPPITILDTLIRLDSEREMPLHTQVRRAIQRVIEDHFEDGQQFWTEQALTTSLNVSQITVRRALGDLAKEGLLIRRKSKGSVVCKPDPNAATNYRVALFSAQFDSDLLRTVLEQFVEGCRLQGRRLDIFFIQKDHSPSDIMQMLEYGPQDQRLVFWGLPTDLGNAVSQLAADRGYRFVILDMHTPHHVTDSVGTDDVEGVRVALQHLADFGHRRVTLVVNEPEAAEAVIVRRRTFDTVTKSLGMTGHIVSCGTNFWESAYDAAYDVMPRIWDMVDAAERPTALMTVSDVGAWAILKWFAEQEIRVPQDVSVVGYNDERPSRFTYPTLTTIRINVPEMVKETLQLLELPKTERTEVLVHPSLIVRGSTAALSTGRSKRPRSRKRTEPLLVVT